jgi:hypothetical protein
MRVRKGATYRYNPALLDMVDARTDLQKGELVRVIQLPGAPPPNTMGHAHVERVSDGKFAGLVQTASLEKP